MTVINPNSISGITSITLPSGGDNVLTIHTNDGTERFRIDSSGNVKVGSAATISQDGDVFFTGVTTATTFTGAHSGSGANLTSLPAAQLTGSLPAISGANLTGIAATDNVRTGILDVAGIATFRNDVNIGTAVTISESGIEASGIGITVANINGGQIGGRRNIIINGAMMIAQRGTSSTSNDNALHTLDRFRATFSGTDETPTQAQVDVSSGTSPYTEGFRKAFKITNGNQTSGAGADDYVRIGHGIEAQDIANSGWNYTSSSSFITFSFWVKSSVAQSFKVELYADDGTAQAFSFDTGSLSADTWTKVIKTIPGNSNLTFSDDTGEGLYIRFLPFFGTSFSSSSYTEDTWAAYSGTARIKDMTSTWYTTNDATFELTGVQLEVGSQATPFEHRNFNDDMLSCKRYYQKIDQTLYGCAYSTGSGFVHHYHNPEMRATPTFTYTGRATSSGFNHASYSNHKIFQCIMSHLSSYLQGAEWDAEIS